jgi:8-oxo-dGTP diphosphatase
MRPVRVSVKAIIIEDGRLLALRSNDARVGTWYELPGGGQEPGETVPQALRRECREEIGCEVTIGALRFVRDYIADHHEFALWEGGIHQVELMFECRLASPPRPGHLPDAYHTGFEWLELATLAGTRFFPRALIDYLTAADPSPAPLYLGDVN